MRVEVEVILVSYLGCFLEVLGWWVGWVSVGIDKLDFGS